MVLLPLHTVHTKVSLNHPVEKNNTNSDVAHMPHTKTLQSQICKQFKIWAIPDLFAHLG